MSTRRTRKWLWLALAAGGVVVVFSLVLWLGDQPGGLYYRGQSFERVVELGGPMSAEQAMGELGYEKTIPVLVDMLGRNDGPIKKLKLLLWRKLPIRVQRKYVKSMPMPAESTRMKLASTLMSIGPEASNAVPALIRLVKATPHPANGFYIAALAETGRDSREAMETLFALGASGDSNAASAVALELPKFDFEGPRVVSFLASNIQSKSTPPYNELVALRSFGTNAAPAATAVAHWLDVPAAQGNVVSAFSRMGPAAVIALPRLTELAASNNHIAIEALLNIGPAAAPALPVLTNVMKGTNGVRRVLAVAAIGKITGDEAWAAGELAPLLKAPVRGGTRSSPSWSPPWSDMRHLSVGFGERETICWFLAEMGTNARVAIPALREAMAKTNGWYPILAARALGKMGDDNGPVIARLVKALDVKDRISPMLAARSLRDMGANAKAAVPELQRVRTDSWKLRREVNDALAQIQAGQGAEATPPASGTR